MYVQQACTVSFSTTTGAAKNELTQEEITRVVPHSRQAGNPFEMQQTWWLKEGRRNAANLLGKCRPMVHVYCTDLFAVGGRADSRPFRTRKYPRGLEKGQKERERDLHGVWVCVCVWRGEDDPTGPLLRKEWWSRATLDQSFFFSFFSIFVCLFEDGGGQDTLLWKSKGGGHRDPPFAKKRVTRLAGKSHQRITTMLFIYLTLPHEGALVRKREKKKT